MANYGPNDGPLGTAPDISIGASDALLLGVSFAGFLALAWSVYSIVLTKLKTARELLEEEEEREISYDERLAKADVSTLNRAQRRARARHIMKQQRRVAPHHPHHGPPAEEDEGHGGRELLLEQEGEAPFAEPVPAFRDETHHSTAQNLLSRKERQKAAKQVELQERRLLEEDRRREQKLAQEAAMQRKKERERKRVLEAEQGRKEREEQRRADELEGYRAWKVFLEDGETILTVGEWIRELREHRVVGLKDLAERFRIGEAAVRNRIRELLEESRVSGVLEESPAQDGGGSDSVFVYLSPQEMATLASYVKGRDKTTAKELAARIEELVAPTQ
ncbi:unnamed protein product [Pseudo-nitzschia multistriata]|uniref:DDRGK domain-containing protein 1 n=1 Tax=Pseudo-nitzschia multistriata TaxID=183589 RepID=A0A448YU85_9STRA|nr:unnamed protein product [Pseudo-nitzschia multistriata]